jgi:hypothetical protein
LSAGIEHPFVLLVAVALSAPFIWQIGRSWFGDIEQNAQDALTSAAVEALGGSSLWTRLPLKILWFALVSAAIVITFYKVGSWIVEW